MKRLRQAARILGLFMIVVGIASAWVLVLPPMAASQPVEFNHAKHQPIACATCHTGVVSGARAGLPDGNFCAKCHATAPAGVGASQWARVVEAPSASWVLLTHLPDHVRFSHERHVGAGRLECASCHGDVGRRTSPAPRNPMRLDMSTCVTCHRREAVTEDCTACHR